MNHWALSSIVWFSTASCVAMSVSCTGELAVSLPSRPADDGGPSTAANGSGASAVSTAPSAASPGSSAAVSSSGPGTTGVTDAAVVPADASPDPDCTSLAVPALARVCPDGSTAAATYVLEDHTCVLVYPCDAGAAPPPPGCNSSSPAACADASPDASDASSSPDAARRPVCNFLLPRICEVCSDGTTACAHYAVKNGRCVTEICPPGGDADAADVDSSPDASDAAPDVVTKPACNFLLPNICEMCSDGSLACAHYAIENGMCVTEICPPGTGPGPVDGGPSACEQNAACAPNGGCGFASTADGGGCETSCACDATGHLQCVRSCAPMPSGSGCSEGAVCPAMSSCDAGIDVDGCAASCACSVSGALHCTAACP